MSFHKVEALPKHTMTHGCLVMIDMIVLKTLILLKAVHVFKSVLTPILVLVGDTMQVLNRPELKVTLFFLLSYTYTSLSINFSFTSFLVELHYLIWDHRHSGLF